MVLHTRGRVGRRQLFYKPLSTDLLREAFFVCVIFLEVGASSPGGDASSRRHCQVGVRYPNLAMRKCIVFACQGIEPCQANADAGTRRPQVRVRSPNLAMRKCNVFACQGIEPCQANADAGTRRPQVRVRSLNLAIRKCIVFACQGIEPCQANADAGTRRPQVRTRYPQVRTRFPQVRTRCSNLAIREGLASIHVTYVASE